MFRQYQWHNTEAPRIGQGRGEITPVQHLSISQKRGMGILFYSKADCPSEAALRAIFVMQGYVLKEYDAGRIADHVIAMYRRM